MRRLTFMFAAGLLAAAGTGPAAADDRALSRLPLLPAYRQECGACHLAYPPGLLPAASWDRLMTSLPRHFGTDASLDAATLKQIHQWLQVHAADAGGGRRAAAAPPDDRITRSAWFQREHREVGAAVWTRPAVKSAANCAACHPRADQGDFDEHLVRLPR